jgi:hypothetical protein
LQVKYDRAVEFGGLIECCVHQPILQRASAASFISTSPTPELTPMSTHSSEQRTLPQ